RKPELHSDFLLRSNRVEALSTLDKNLATTLVMGVLRWQLVLQQRIREALTKSKSHLADPVQVSLELGALQLLLLDRIPAHAAIFESVELVKQSGEQYAAGLVNAVLRKLAQGQKLQDSDAVAAHPAWMVERWVAAYGQETAEAVCRYDQLPPPTTIRHQADGLKLEEAAFVVSAKRVISGEVKAGVRIQDEGSQLIAELAGRGQEILDCCAAPGGKTAILAERNPAASITACDINPARLKAMQKNLPGLGIHFRVLDVTQFPFEKQFDLVLCDAPCSGTGTLSRNPEIRYRLTPADLARHHDRQVRLLCSAMRALRKGGRLIYSTCSLEAEENETVVVEALEREKGFRLLPWENQIQSLEHDGVLHAGTAGRLAAGDFLRTFPGLYPGDGFFAACLVHS
ncbi:MAG TPA: transcription antitermination factor NusB, partial [Acidobacteriaceae bacterium]|nr:transcription antitermination factor NusB [Acidobacteriaceae bacterium]